jgi:hypothetical protein
MSDCYAWFGMGEGFYGSTFVFIFIVVVHMFCVCSNGGAHTMFLRIVSSHLYVYSCSRS